MKKIYLLTSLTVALLTLSACNLGGKISTSGDLASSSGIVGDAATYSITANDCSGTLDSRFRFADRPEGIRRVSGTANGVKFCTYPGTSGDFQFDLLFNDCSNTCPHNTLRVGFEYAGSNRRTFDGGTGKACIGMTKGDPNSVADVAITIADGRYAGLSYNDSIADEVIKFTPCK